MQGGNIHALELVFLLLLFFVVAFAELARRLKTPFPIVLVLAGLLLSFVPGIPPIRLSPDLIFFVVLPPLLYSAAWLTSWRDFQYHLVSILLLAFGLVTFTVFGVAAAATRVFPGFDWRTGFVLGAVISTTDAIAATSIGKRLGLPQRVVDILEGESLVNDASGLLALEFGIAMVVQQQTPTVTSALARLAYLTVVGLAIGLVVGLVVEWFERRIDDGPIEITISLLVPYAAYLAAEEARASGVLAVVASGLYLSRKSAHFFSPNVRIQIYSVWQSLTFVLNGVVFVLIGLQLPYVREGIRDYNLRELLIYGALFSAIVILLRLIWVFPGAHLAIWIRQRLLRQNEQMPPKRQIFIVGWTGMRGVIALAAALALPETLADGSPFPQRNLIVFLTFCVILVTLVLQGLTLPALIRRLGLAGPQGRHCGEKEARRIVLESALAHIEAAREEDRPEFASVYDDLAQHYRERLENIVGSSEDQDGAGEELYGRLLDLSLELNQVERQTAVRLRNEGRINDEVFRELERELDLDEVRLQEREAHGP
ncbi:MAG: Na+/H+ antiporter [Acidobacteriaceae bacterium]|nr:Na+/H+ antiporter [Acidobacteriaceae bacterium]